MGEGDYKMTRKKSSGRMSLPRHSTPVKDALRQSEFEITQYIPLNKDLQSCRPVICHRCRLFCEDNLDSGKIIQTGPHSIKKLINWLELAKQCLTKDTELLSRALDHVLQASRNSNSLWKTLNDHWEDTFEMNERLSHASTAIHALIDKEEKLFSEILSHSTLCYPSPKVLSC